MPGGVLGVVVEGVTCAGKTTLLRALLRHPAYLARAGLSSLVLTEHHTQRVLEALPAPGRDEHLALLRAHVAYLQGIAARVGGMTRWMTERLPNPRFTVVLERFHLTHVLACPGLAWDDVADIDAALAELGVTLVVVRAERGELLARVRRERPQRFASMAVQEERLLELASRSRMARLEVDTTATAAETLAGRVWGSVLA